MDAPPPLPAGEHAPFDCSACGRRMQGHKPDDAGRCAECRSSLVRRAGAWAWAPAVVVAALYLWLLVATGMMESPAMVFFLALGAALAFAAYKVGRRVAFEMLVTRRNGER